MVLETFVEAGGATLWTVAQGRGRPVVLCNGGPGCCDYLGPAAEMLTDRFQVVRFEERGCGRSSPTPPYDVETCIADLEAVRNHYGLERWVVGGHSWGADLALLYALARPSRVSGLLCLSGGHVHNDREWHRAYRRRRDEEGEVLPEFAYPPNLEVNEQVNASWKAHVQRPTLFRELSCLEVPALFVYGERDIRPSWPVEQVAQLTPNARFRRLHGAAHAIWFTRAEALRELLRDFLTSSCG